MGRVGVSMATGAVRNVFQSLENREELRADRIVQNAIRVAETLGNLKGAPMKLGQMLSLHEGLLPPEASAVLGMLQKEAPAIPFSSIQQQIKNELKENYSLIEHIEPEAYAAASIGQVHRARLNDGREVVFKVQYPDIDKVIEADMKNVRGLMGMIFSMFTKMDLQPIWEEMNEIFMEELDYYKEAEHMRRAKEVYSSSHDIIIPDVIKEASSRTGLCMSFVEGISPDQACSGEYPDELRDRWGVLLFKLLLSGLFDHNFLHADPNMANFAFLENGKIIVYDFGCMKDVPENLSRAYALLVQTVFNENYQDAQEILKSIGIHKSNGEVLPEKMIQEYAELLIEPFQPDVMFTYGENNDIYDQIIDLGRNYWFESLEIEFPKDIIFIHRTIGGHFGNLIRLKATANWRSILDSYT